MGRSDVEKVINVLGFGKQRQLTGHRIEVRIWISHGAERCGGLWEIKIMKLAIMG